MLYVNRQKSCSAAPPKIKINKELNEPLSDRSKHCERGLYLVGGGGSAFQSPDIMGFIFFSRKLWLELHLNINQQEWGEKKKSKKKWKMLHAVVTVLYIPLIIHLNQIAQKDKKKSPKNPHPDTHTHTHTHVMLTVCL